MKNILWIALGLLGLGMILIVLGVAIPAAFLPGTYVMMLGFAGLFVAMVVRVMHSDDRV